jgi:hypothetical protein
VNIGFARCLANLTSRLAKQGIEHEVIVSLGSVLPQLRTDIAKTAMLKNYDWLLWLDSDMHFPDNVVEKLRSHHAHIVAATYSTRSSPQRSVAFNDLDNTEDRLASGTGLHQVAAVGMGCMLVHRSVYEKIPEPWYSHLWNNETKTFSGEDVYFCHLAGTYDIKVHVDLDLSKELAHYGTKAYLLQETQDFT